MADVALFDLEPATTWAPVYNVLAVDAMTMSKPEWKAHLGSRRCRDCGSLTAKVPTTRACGGGGPEGQYELCDGCAALDGRGERGDGTTDVSRWGICSTDAEAEVLLAAQARRRLAYEREARRG